MASTCPYRAAVGPSRLCSPGHRWRWTAWAGLAAPWNRAAAARVARRPHTRPARRELRPARPRLCQGTHGRPGLPRPWPTPRLSMAGPSRSPPRHPESSAMTQRSGSSTQLAAGRPRRGALTVPQGPQAGPPSSVWVWQLTSTWAAPGAGQVSARLHPAQAGRVTPLRPPPPLGGQHLPFGPRSCANWTGCHPRRALLCRTQARVSAPQQPAAWMSEETAAGATAPFAASGLALPIPCRAFGPGAAC